MDKKGISLAFLCAAIVLVLAGMWLQPATAQNPPGEDPLSVAGITPTPTVPPQPPDEPGIDIRKQLEGPDRRPIQIGSDVSFEIAVTNTGNVSLTDVVVSDELAPGCARTIGELSPGASETFTCTVPQVTQPFTNTACVSGKGGSVEVEDCDPSTVNPAYLIFIPYESRPYAYEFSVSYEDLEIDNPFTDYDYNDFNASIRTVFTTDPETLYLTKLTFVITPRARGGVYSHALHMRFPANTFSSDGTSTLTLKDGNGNTVSTLQELFIASQEKDFTVIPCTCDAYPNVQGFANTEETAPYVFTQRTAELSIEFFTPGPVDVELFDEAKVEITHAAGLFFDPYLYVYNTGEEVHQGDHRMVSAPGIYWLWPEERVRIDRAYTMITGDPPDEVFPPGWWSVHNTCIYGDGIPCE